MTPDKPTAETPPPTDVNHIPERRQRPEFKPHGNLNMDDFAQQPPDRPKDFGGQTRFPQTPEQGLAQPDAAGSPSGYGGHSYGGTNVPDGKSGYGDQTPIRTGESPFQIQHSDNPTDQRIATDLYASISQYPGLNSRDVRISIDQGRVVLIGAVDDSEQRHLLEDLAEQSPGVREVYNQLQVDPPSGQATNAENSSTEKPPLPE